MCVGLQGQCAGPGANPRVWVPALCKELVGIVAQQLLLEHPNATLQCLELNSNNLRKAHSDGLNSGDSWVAAMGVF